MTSRFLRAVLLVALLVGAVGCVAHQHRVGTGPAGVATETARQWYLFFGLMELNEVDSQRFTGDAVSYDIETKFGFVDLVFTVLLGPLTVTSRTVTIDR